MKTIYSILIICLMIVLNSASFVQAEDKTCDRLRKLKAPQPFFMDNDDEGLLKVRKVKNPSAKEAQEKTSPASGNYYFIPSYSKGIVFVNRDYSLELSVPEYDFRPLSFGWINPKLIYVDLSLNPNRGAYWIYDVEKEKIILHELDADGWQEWEQCTGKEFIRNDKTKKN